MKRLRLLLAACLSVQALPVRAGVKFDIVPYGVELLSRQHPSWDTVVVQTYVYNSAETTFVNATGKPLLYLDLLIDSESGKRHFLAPGDSFPATSGFFERDTLTVIKAPFVVSTWADPLWSFGKGSSVAKLRVSSLFIDLYGKVDTLYVEGCAPGTFPIAVEGPRPALAPEAGPAVVYNVLGRPLWSGRLHAGVNPLPELRPGSYLIVQGNSRRILKIAP